MGKNENDIGDPEANPGCALGCITVLAASPLPVGTISVLSQRTAFKEQIYSGIEKAWLIASDIIKWGIYSYAALELLQKQTFDIESNTALLSIIGIIATSQILLMLDKAFNYPNIDS